MKHFGRYIRVHNLDFINYRDDISQTSMLRTDLAAAGSRSVLEKLQIRFEAKLDFMTVNISFSAVVWNVEFPFSFDLRRRRQWHNVVYTLPVIFQRPRKIRVFPQSVQTHQTCRDVQHEIIKKGDFWCQKTV